MKNNLDIYNAIKEELQRERETLEMIASENFTSKAVLDVVGSILTNKYAEGYPAKRYYGGCEAVDKVENIARSVGRDLFNSEYINVQPHSGSQANMAVFLTFLNLGDTVMGLNLSHGGHLTHGSHVNFSGKLYNFVSYNVDRDTGRVDFDEILKIAKKNKPKMIICGGSAYPRFVEFEKFKEVANEVGAFLMADIAHPSGLIAAGIHPSPWPYCDIATSTTHKTLRGPRGGIIMAGKDFANPWNIIAPKSGRVKNISELLDSSVMPGIQGGPLMHVIAGKAVAFRATYVKESILPFGGFLGCGLTNVFYSTFEGGMPDNLYMLEYTNDLHPFIDVGVSKNLGTSFTVELGYRHIFSGEKTDEFPVYYEEKAAITSRFVFRQKKTFFTLLVVMMLIHLIFLLLLDHL